MATVSGWNPFGVALDITATASNIRRTSATEFKANIAVSWETYYSGANTTYGMKVTSGGKTAYIPAYTGSSKSSGSGTLTDATFSISGNGAQTKSITVAFNNYNTDKGDSKTQNVTISGVKVLAWTSYTITYNANGGSGAPGKQTKWKDQTLTLSSTKPTRTGYSFQGWALTKADADAGTWYYQAGGTCGKNENLTLYAVWKANTYKVTFNANGGTGAPAAQTKTYGKTLTLSSTEPTRTNYNFKGWGTSASATTVSYAAGASYTSNAAITLYAVWELAYTKPRISGFSVKRCNSEGVVSDEGTYALVQFTWGCDKANPTITIECIATGGTVVNTETPSVSGTSGTVNVTVGAGLLSADSAYTIHVTVTDSNGYYDRSLTLNGNLFPIDALRGGNGIAFGKPAESSGMADFAFNASFDNTKSIYGVDLTGTRKSALSPQNQNGDTVLGWGNYAAQSGTTGTYGHNVRFGISDLEGAKRGALKNSTTEGIGWRPYITKGDSVTYTVKTSGYVTNSGQDVAFLVPISVPIVNASSVTVTSTRGFVLRQGNSYTHGSASNTFVTPDSYTASKNWVCGVFIAARFSNVTNVTNNDAIGVYWEGTITFS